MSDVVLRAVRRSSSSIRFISLPQDLLGSIRNDALPKISAWLATDFPRETVDKPLLRTKSLPQSQARFPLPTDPVPLRRPRPTSSTTYSWNLPSANRHNCQSNFTI